MKMVSKGAELSKDGMYRHTLWRFWEFNSKKVLWIMLNPSTADENNDDATIRRCINFTNSWGYSGLCVCNLFDFRAKEIADMKMAEKPQRENNINVIVQTALRCDLVVCAWSNHGSYLGMDEKVKKALLNEGIELHYLKLNKTGSPSHPLYLKSDLVPVLWGN